MRKGDAWKHIARAGVKQTSQFVNASLTLSIAPFTPPECSLLWLLDRCDVSKPVSPSPAWALEKPVDCVPAPGASKAAAAVVKQGRISETALLDLPIANVYSPCDVGPASFRLNPVKLSPLFEDISLLMVSD